MSAKKYILLSLPLHLGKLYNECDKGLEHPLDVYFLAASRTLG